MNYGRQVLTHPLLVEAAQELFVPACVYNNTKDDADAKVLKSFGERAWNNPVVRFLNADRKDMIPKVHKDWGLARLSGAMVDALKAAKREAPKTTGHVNAPTTRTGPHVKGSSE